MAYILSHWFSWVITIAILVGAIIVARIIHYAVFTILKRMARGPKRVVEAAVYTDGYRPAKWIFSVLAVLIVLPTLPIPEMVKAPAEHVVGLVLIAIVGWTFMLAARIFSDVIIARNRIDVADNLAARRIRTQVQVLRRIVSFVVIIVTGGIMLLTIPQVRAIGTSVLASAGLAGLVLGMAMKPTLSNLAAGVEIALTQPFRIEDAVIVENQWGWIEDITLTYVVVRIWNWQRLVLPISYFIEHPFQNWTKNTAELIGSVHFFVDYTVSVDELRKELDRIVRTTDKWRGQVCVLQVVEATDRAMQLRALADAKDAGTAWDLRCYIREGLIKFLQEHHPQSLPRTRAELHGLPEPASAVQAINN
ncbi:MAG: mechanosensitive ion channel family protein [Terriglobia bacterium]